PIREEVRIGDRVLHSVVTPLLAPDTDEPMGAIVVLRDLGDTADIARKRAEFAQVMSHELRTPLTSIAGALDIVLSGYAGPLPDRQLRYVHMARPPATPMNQPGDQLLDQARAQAGRSSAPAGLAEAWASRSRGRAGASAELRSACRSRARSSKLTAGGSGSRPARPVRSSCSRCRCPPRRPRLHRTPNPRRAGASSVKARA